MTAEVGLEVSVTDADRGYPFSAAPDVNDDGWPDIFLGLKGPNYLYLNDRQGGFRDATTSEIGDSGINRGIAVGDIDNDGDLDLFQAAAEGLVLDVPFRSQMLLNLGEAGFLDVTGSVGLGPIAEVPITSAALADVDNDGDLDLITGRPTFLFLNNGEGTFTEASDRSGFNHVSGNGLVVGDYNRDGCLDLIFGYGPTLFDNTFGPIYHNAGNSNNYLRVELVGSESNRAGIGARIIAKSGTLRQTRELLGGQGLVQHEPVAHFGLGARTKVDTLWVRWPSGHVDVLVDIPADQQVRIFEGTAGYHTAEPTNWEHTMPVSVVPGEALELAAVVSPAIFSPSGRVERVNADLSAWGGPVATLVASGSDSYVLEPVSVIVEGAARPQGGCRPHRAERGSWTKLDSPGAFHRSIVTGTPDHGPADLCRRPQPRLER